MPHGCMVLIVDIPNTHTSNFVLFMFFFFWWDVLFMFNLLFLPNRQLSMIWPRCSLFKDLQHVTKILLV